MSWLSAMSLLWEQHDCCFIARNKKRNHVKHVASACFENSNSSVIEDLGLMERVAGCGSRRFEGTCLQEFKVISQEDGIRVASACTCLFSGIFQVAVLVFIPSDFW